jgi:hypothetical protein
VLTFKQSLVLKNILNDEEAEGSVRIADVRE